MDPLPPGAERLFEAPFEDFVTERARLAKELRAGGDREAAAAVAALRKPTAVAWALNHVAHTEPGLINKLAQCAGRLRQAHGEGGDELRSATVTYRDAMREVIAAARAHGPGGRPLSEALAERLRATLLAAAADPELAERVRAGRLTEEVEGAVMFGDAGVPPAPSAGDKRGAPAADQRGSAGDKGARSTRRRKATDEGAEEADARRQAEEAAAREAAAREAAERERRRAQLQGRLDAAVSRRDEARAAIGAARDALEAAEAALEDADEEVEGLQAQLDELG